jgi:lariat debranching enzyme
MRSIYHIREYNVRRLALVSICQRGPIVDNYMMIQLSSPEVFLSHDWPSGVEQHGNLNDLLRRKPFFRGDIQSKQLGSPPLMSLLRNLKPSWWFAAHLHTRFEARVQHDPPGPPAVVARNPDEIAIGDEDDDFDVPTSTTAPQNLDEIVLENEIETVAPPPPAPRETKFLALDKCLPRRQFLEAGRFLFFWLSVILRLLFSFVSLQVVDILAKEEGPSSEGPTTVVLSYDPEWLAITRAFQPYLSRKREQAVYPEPDAARAAVAREWDWVHAHALPNLGAECRVDACQQFVQGVDGARQQTDAFVALLEMENVVR